MSFEELVQSVWLGAQQLRWDDDWLPVSEAFQLQLQPQTLARNPAPSRTWMVDMPMFLVMCLKVILL